MSEKNGRIKVYRCLVRLVGMILPAAYVETPQLHRLWPGCLAPRRMLAGYSGEACVPVVVSGTRQLVRWRDRQAIDGLAGQAFRIQVTLA